MFAKHQFKYTYKEGCEDFSPLDVTFDIPGDATLQQMLYNFQSYLKACGFVFDGELEIVDHTFDVMKDQDDIDEIYGCMADWDKDVLDESEDCCDDECGCKTTSSPLETSEFNKQFDVTKTTASSEDSISVENYQKRRNWTQAEKMLKEWNEGLARLDNEQKQKCMEEALKMSDLHYEATKEVVKNNWVHGMCNPPSPDWKKKK